MGRLIDADKLIELMIKDRDYAEKNGFMDMFYERQHLIDVIREQPTTYDQDKVVEQLEEYREEMEQFKCGGMLSDMMEVIKAGGIVKENELSKDDADLER